MIILIENRLVIPQGNHIATVGYGDGRGYGCGYRPSSGKGNSVLGIDVCCGIGSGSGSGHRDKYCGECFSFGLANGMGNYDYLKENYPSWIF